MSASILVLIAVTLPLVSAAWRTRGYAQTLGIATLIAVPAVADVTVETNGFPVKGRPGGTAMSAMILAGQHSNLNLQVLLSSFVGIYANGQEEAGADAIVAALEKTVTDRGPDLCPNVP